MSFVARCGLDLLTRKAKPAFDFILMENKLQEKEFLLQLDAGVLLPRLATDLQLQSQSSVGLSKVLDEIANFENILGAGAFKQQGKCCWTCQ